MKKPFTTASKSTVLISLVIITFSTTGFSETLPYLTLASVQQHLVEKMGDSARDLAVRVERGTANLSGWARGPREVSHQQVDRY